MRRIVEKGPHARLQITTGRGSGTVIPLILAETLVGRIDSAQLVLDDSTVSRLHARLTVSGDQVFVQDLESREGTWVNGVAVRGPHRLSPGDLVAFGDVLVRFEAGTV
ncbi:MAG: FHA domain-containing protein [Myxococcales bacterium]